MIYRHDSYYDPLPRKDTSSVHHFAVKNALEQDSPGNSTHPQIKCQQKASDVKERDTPIPMTTTQKISSNCLKKN